MHGSMNIKFINAKQATDVHAYNNIKRKLYKTNAAIWLNKTCRDKELTPNVINIRINHFPLSHCSGRQPKTYVKPEAAITVSELLMMSGVSPETC